MKTILFYFIFSCLLLISASCETDTDANRNAADTPNTETMTMLDGTYILTSMDATPAADLNDYGAASVDLLSETDCFDVMEATFNNNGTFTATNAKLDFNGGMSNDELVCTSRTDSGMWSLGGSTLTLTVEIGGNTFTDTTEITLTDTTFSFILTEAEIDEYVDDDGTSSASNIDELFLEYTKL